jgi:hypothetical protein
MTQREQADALLKRLSYMFPELDSVRQELGEVVGMAQNGPPDGEADGSIDPKLWQELLLLNRRLDSLVCNFNYRGKF